MRKSHSDATVRMDIKITPELDHALNELVLATSQSKASLVDDLPEADGQH